MRQLFIYCEVCGNEDVNFTSKCNICGNESVSYGFQHIWVGNEHYNACYLKDKYIEKLKERYFENIAN